MDEQSPIKLVKKPKLSTDYTKCVICQKGGELQTLKPESIDMLKTAAEAHDDKVYTRLKPDFDKLLSLEPKWHKSCRSNWAKKSTVEKAKEQSLSLTQHKEALQIRKVGMATDTSQRITRSDAPTFSWKTNCVICGKSRDKKGIWKLILVATANRSQELYENAKSKKDDVMLLRIRGDGDKPKDLVAYDARYHRSCFVAYRPKLVKYQEEIEQDIYNVALQQLSTEIDVQLFKESKVLYSASVRNKYRAILAKFDVENADKYPMQKLKYKLQAHYGDAITFWPQEYTSDLICSSSLSIGNALQALSDLKQSYSDIVHKRDSVSGASEKITEQQDLQTLFKAAHVIRSNLLKSKSSTSFDYTEGSTFNYSIASSMVPTSLYNFLAWLLQPEDHQNFSEEKLDVKPELDQLILNIAQDFVFHVNNIFTPKHVGIAIYIHSLTRSKSLIRMTNGLGLSVSYDTVRCILTTISEKIQKQVDEKGVFIPSNIRPGIFHQFALDNLDFLEQCRSGFTTHATSSVIYQRQELITDQELSLPNEPREIPALLRERCIDVKSPEIHSCHVKSRGDSGLRITATERILEHTSEEQMKAKKTDLAWLLSRLITSQVHISGRMPSWTAFNAVLSEQDPPITNIEYLPLLCAPPTDSSVVYTVLLDMTSISRTLGMKYTVVTGDQATYKIMKDIQLQKQDEFKTLIVRMGSFHIILNFAGVIGTIMAGCGLQELIVRSGIYGKNTVKKILNGKCYNRMIRTFKHLKCALWNHMFDSFEDYCEQGDVDSNIPECLSAILDSLIDSVTKNDHIKSKKIFDFFAEKVEPLNAQLEEFIKTGKQKSATFRFWYQFLELIDLLLNLLRADRDGNWILCLETLADIIPFTVAAGHVNYGQDLPRYLQDMKDLSKVAPEVHVEFLKGNFVVKRNKGKFNQVSTDQALEQTANRDAKTGGGIIGITTKENTLMRHYNTIAQRGSIVNSVKQMSHSLDTTSAGHRQLSKSAIEHDIADTKKIYDALSDMINPFDIQSESYIPLVNIATGAHASEDISRELLSVKETGIGILDEYLNKGAKKLKHNKLKTFSTSVKKEYSKADMKTQDLLDEISCLRKLSLMKSTEGYEMGIKDALSYEITSLPGSLADKRYGSLRHGNKAELLAVYKAELGRTEWIKYLPKSNKETALVYDAMAFVHRFGKLKGEKYSELSSRYLQQILSDSKNQKKITSIHWVCDRYDQKYSTKEVEHERRAKNLVSSTPIGHQVTGNIVIPQWENFITHSNNKAALLQFLCEDWCQNAQTVLPAQTKLYISGGFHEREKAVMISRRKLQSIPQLQSDQEEADTRLLLHVAYAAEMGNSRVIIAASDTDVVTLCIHHYPHITRLKELWIWKSSMEFIPIHDIVSSMGPILGDAMLAFHATTGCDTTSRFYRKGKKTAMRIMRQNKNIAEGMSQIGNFHLTQENVVSDAGIQAARKLVLGMYGHMQFESLNELRAHLYCSKDIKDLDILPPTENAFYHHMLRVQYQVIIWKKALEPLPVLPSPFDYGWKESNKGTLTPVFLSQASFPENLRKKASCKCQKGRCRIRCPCEKAGPCTIACLCSGKPERCDTAKINESSDSDSESDFESDLEFV